MEDNSQGGAVGGGNISSSGSQGGGQPSGGSSNPNNPNLSGSGGGPTVYELSEDSMVKLPGAKDPVRYGDHYRGFQSEFTKRAQEAARLKQELQKRDQQLADFQRRLQTQQQQGQAQQPNKSQELLQSIKSLNYLSGEDAARVVEHITQQFASQESALQQRDAAIALMYKQMQRMGQVLNGLHKQHTSTEFESKISRFVKEAGLPEGATNFAKTVYLAHEGDDLDVEFPSILKRFWEDATGVYKSQEKARVEAARRQPFVPGKGGNGTPSRPLAQDFTKKSAADIANALWPGMVDGEVET